MELKFRCGECNRKLEASATMAGSVVSCPSCGADVTIPEAHLGPGVTLAGFRIEKEIGHGAMGRVFLATQLAVERRVALKVLPSPRVADSEYVERFFHEVRLAARVAHPNIVSAFDAGEDHGYYYFAMGLVDGESLDSRVRRAGPLPEKEALTYAVGIAEALSHAWKQSRILHRDVKPANIMVGAERRPMLMDMGIAKNVGDESHLTATGVAVGTPHYMSPEQARGSQDLDFRADMYSLGASLFHLVAGRVPFIGTSAVEVITKHLHDPVPSVRSLKPDVSQECEDIILRMMAKDKAHRYGTWEACIHDLRAVVKGRMPETTKTRLAKQASEHLVQQRAYVPTRAPGTATVGTGQALFIVGGAILALAALVSALVFLWGERDRPAMRLRTPPSAAAPVQSEPAATAQDPPREVGAAAEPVDPVSAAPPAEPSAPTPTAPQTDPSPAEDVPAAGEGGKATIAEATLAPAAPAPVEPPAPPDPLTAALRQAARELVARRPSGALAAWDQAGADLAAAQPASLLAGIRASLAYVGGTELRVLESFRRDVGQAAITVRLKEGPRQVQIRGVNPPTITASRLVERGTTGANFAYPDLDTAEKLARLPEPADPDKALARGLVALWDQQPELAAADLKRFDTPLIQAVHHVLAARAGEQRELAAERAGAELLRQVLRATPPREPEKLVRQLRECLDTPKRRKAFEDRLEGYEAAHGGSAVGAQMLRSLRPALVYPFPESGWVVPEIGIEFTWVPALACWAGTYEVTNAQYRRLVPEHDSATGNDLLLNADEQPAVWLSFEDAEGYAAALTQREQAADRLPAGFRYRLPQADQWTAMAQCGDQRKFPWGDTWPPPPEANCNGSEWPGPEEERIAEHRDPYPASCPVSKAGRNGLGLFGIGGNAMEWTGGANGTTPELRGNAWCGLGGRPSPSNYTVASAWPRPRPNFRSAATGLRLLLAPEPKPKTALAAPAK
jgi:serine/threonine-protein kinase